MRKTIIITSSIILLLGIIYFAFYFSVPKTSNGLDKPCKVGGCSGQICSDEDVMTTCEYSPAYACYKSAICERGKNGKCGWQETDELKSCLNEAKKIKDTEIIY